MSTNFTEFNGARLRYTDTGPGSAMIFLHGFCESLSIWDSFLPHINDSFRIVTIDLPGHGETSPLAKVHSMELMADAVRHVMVEAQITQCMMVGHSMGGYVALAFAEKYPKLLNGLCLFHSGPLADSEAKKADRTRAIEAIGKDKKSFVTTLIPKLFTPDFRKAHPTLVDFAIDIAMKTPAAGIAAALAGMRDRPDKQQVLKQIEMPVLMILGKQDGVLPYADNALTASLPAEGLLYTLDQVAHMGFMEAPAKTASILAHFGRYCADFSNPAQT